MYLSLNYKLLKKPKTVLLTTAFVVVAYNTLAYFHPTNQGWIEGEGFSWTNLIKFILIDQFLIELITISILFFLIRFYTKWQRLYELHLSAVAISKYLLRFLPVFLVAFFIFNPFTQSARFLLNEYGNWEMNIYLNDYLLNWKLYIVYLIPVFLGGYGVLLYNLMILHSQQLAQAGHQIEQLNTIKRYPTKLIVLDDWGEVPLNTDSVIWFEKEERKYYAHALTGKFKTRETISELESSLDPSKFVRINRSVIVNVSYILNYSFWENEKYVLRLKDKANTEFTMSRERLNKIKAQLKLT